MCYGKKRFHCMRGGSAHPDSSEPALLHGHGRFRPVRKRTSSQAAKRGQCPQFLSLGPSGACKQSSGSQDPAGLHQRKHQSHVPPRCFLPGGAHRVLTSTRSQLPREIGTFQPPQPRGQATGPICGFWAGILLSCSSVFGGPGSPRGDNGLPRGQNAELGRGCGLHSPVRGP